MPLPAVFSDQHQTHTLMEFAFRGAGWVAMIEFCIQCLRGEWTKGSRDDLGDKSAERAV